MKLTKEQIKNVIAEGKANREEMKPLCKMSAEFQQFAGENKNEADLWLILEGSGGFSHIDEIRLCLGNTYAIREDYTHEFEEVKEFIEFDVFCNAHNYYVNFYHSRKLGYEDHFIKHKEKTYRLFGYKYKEAPEIYNYRMGFVCGGDAFIYEHSRGKEDVINVYANKVIYRLVEG